MISPTGQIIKTPPRVIRYLYKHHGFEVVVDAKSVNEALAIGGQRELDANPSYLNTKWCRPPCNGGYVYFERK
jgi:hypothetical protein